MNNFLKRLLALIVCLIVASPVFATNGYFAHGYGTKNKGLVGAGVALPQDAMIAATNPAGMVFVGERMDVGAAIFSPSPRTYDVTGAASNVCAPACSFSIGPQSNESENDYFLIPHFGYNWMLSSDSSAGITVYGNGGMNTEWKGGDATYFVPAAWGGPNAFITTPGTYGNDTAGVNLEQLFINGSYARKFAPNASYGVSVIFAYQRFEAKGVGSFAPFSTDPGNLSDNGVDTSTGFGFKLGVQGEASPGLTLAASYQSQMKMGEFDDYSGLFAEDGGFDIPATVTLGLAWKATPNGTVIFDYQRIYYSKVDSIANDISPLTDGVSCVPGNPATGGGTGSGCLGGDSGAGFGWEDMSIIKIGYQWTVGSMPGWTWRAGYSQGDQPIPDSEVIFNILAPAVIEQHLTFGFTKDIDPQTEFNFSFMYALENSIQGTSAFDPGQQIELEMSQFELEANYSKKF